LCEPCQADADCKTLFDSDALCLPYGDGKASDPGSYCGGACDKTACPTGFECAEVKNAGGATVKQCKKTDATCSCNAHAVAQKLSTACSTVNGLGTCKGARVCSEAGLSACDAKEPAAETCNGEDDDCDGKTDEDTCDDKKPCTEDKCDAAQKVCVFNPLAGPCDDGNLCTTGDTCSVVAEPGQPVTGECKGKDKVCDDQNPCTDDTCDPAKGCGYANVDGPCSTGNPCEVGAKCEAGLCKGGATKNCDDGNVCTVDLCDAATGTCVTKPVDTPCDDNNACTSGDVCKGGACSGKAKTCDDNDPCTDDTCVADGGCKQIPNTDACDDGNACTTGDKCSTEGCQGKPTDCDDKNDCTNDTCDAKAGCKHAAQQTACDDGNACTQADVCGASGCAGKAVDCDDKNPCTDDKCDAKSGCKSAPNTVPCNDDDPCTTGDKCKDAECKGSGGQNCDDKNPCTTDTCSEGKGCQSLPNTLPCDDANPCTEGDVCAGKACKAGTPVKCDDKNPCTTDTCDVKTGSCGFAANTAVCDDGDPCTTDDKCAAGDCDGAPKVCDDKNACTADSCDKTSGACKNAASTGSCDDGSACTQNDACSAGTCKGAAISCDDKNVCTDDSCDAKLGCAHKANTLACDDGSKCTTGDVCMAGVCKGVTVSCDDKNPCTDDVCDKLTGCANNPNKAVCDDGSKCTSGDVCGGGACAGKPIVCNDNNVCTTDGCDKLKGCTVVALPNGATCSDGSVCTTGDICTNAVCAGKAISCDDKNSCTADSCDKLKGCQNVALAAGVTCTDGSACTAGDVCAAGGVCKPGAPVVCDDKNPCTNDTCDVATGCNFTNNALFCDDQDACTGAGKCSLGKCTPGAAISCDDKNVCTNDSCDKPKGCLHVNNTLACDDGNNCTTGDKCANGKCAGTGGPNCDDLNPCTTDGCEPGKGCTHAFNTLDCSDGNACTTADKCSLGKCVAGPAPNCDDADPCTTDACDKATGCTHANNTAVCSDGNACTSGDQCSSGKCVGGAGAVCNDSNACTGDSCDPAKGCVFSPLDVPCSDGNACTVGDKCSAGKCVAGAAQKCDDLNPCTTDACDTTKGCTFTSNTNPCDDKNACTTGDKCAANKCEPGPATVCDDKNPCTSDSCDPVKGCQFTNNTATCNDGDGCTSGEKCSGGVCGGGVAKVCDDANPCTDDSCDKASGNCVFALNTACAVKTLPLVDPVDCNDADWFASAAQGGVGWASDGTSASPGKLTGLCSLNYNDGTAYPGTTSGTATGAFLIDATAAKAVTLSFWSWNGADPAENLDSVDVRSLEASADGFNTVVAPKTWKQSVDKGKWVLEYANLNALAGKKFQVRFKFASVDSAFNAGPGWFVDQVNVYAGPAWVVGVGGAVDEPFASGNPNGWQFSSAVGGVQWAIDATAADPGKFGGDASLNFNNGTNFTSSTSSAVNGTALAPVVDLTALPAGSKAHLLLRSWFDTEHTQSYDRRYAEATLDAWNTNTVAVQFTNTKAWNGWTFEWVDLSALAGKRFQLRLRFDSIDSIGNSGKGWFVDNLHILALQAPAFGDGVVASDTTRWTIANSQTCGVGWAIDATPNPPGFSSADASLNFNDGTDFTCNSGAIKVAGTATSSTFATPAVPANQKLYLSFQAFQDVEASTSLDKLTVNVSDHGFGTAPNLSFAVSKAQLQAWTSQKFDLGAVAGKPSVQVQFAFTSVDSIGNGGKGVFVDDVLVRLEAAPISPPIQ
jgi:hypothetical protein